MNTQHIEKLIWYQKYNETTYWSIYLILFTNFFAHAGKFQLLMLNKDWNFVNQILIATMTSAQRERFWLYGHWIPEYCCRRLLRGFLDRGAGGRCYRLHFSGIFKELSHWSKSSTISALVMLLGIPVVISNVFRPLSFSTLIRLRRLSFQPRRGGLGDYSALTWSARDSGLGSATGAPTLETRRSATIFLYSGFQRIPLIASTDWLGNFLPAPRWYTKRFASSVRLQP